MDDWDPMEDDYRSVTFNSYNRGPGRDLPMESHPRFRTNNSSVPPSPDLYVVGVPLDMNEQGLRNIFSQYGKVLRCFIGDPKGGHQNKRYGFVTFGSISEAQEAICDFDRNNPYNIHVEFARSRNDRRRREEVQNNELENIKQRSYREIECTPQRPSTRAGLLGAAPGQSSSLDGMTKLQVQISGGKKVVSLVNNNNREEETVSTNQSDRCIVEHFMAYGPNNRASSQASYVGVETRCTDYGVLERRVMDNSEDYRCSFVTPQLAQKPCTFCQKLGGFRCPRCKAWYCGQSCQVMDWPEHKLICRVVSSDSDSAAPNGHRRNGYQNSVSHHNRPQRENSGTSGGNYHVNGAPQGSQQTSNSHHSGTSQRDSAPKSYEKSANSGNFNSFETSKADNGTRTSVSSNLNVGREQPVVRSPDKPNTVNVPGADSFSEKGHGRALRNNCSNGSKELRRPLRKPGVPPTENSSKAQSLVTEFFSSGSCEVRVCFIVSPDEFYVQKTSNDGVLGTLLVELHQEATCGKPLNVSLNAGDFCIALFSDGSWYRAKVLKSLDSKSHEVYFVDYGNKYVVQLENMRLLPMKFRSLTDQALMCSVAKISPANNDWDEDSISNFRTLVADITFKCHLHAERNGGALVDLEDSDGQLVSEWMLQLQIAKSAAPVNSTQTVTKTVPNVIESIPAVPNMRERSPSVPKMGGSSPLGPNKREGVSPVPVKSSPEAPPSASSKGGADLSPVPSAQTAVFKHSLPSVLSSMSKSDEPVNVVVTWIVDQNNLWVSVCHAELTKLVDDASVVLAASQENSSSFVPSIGQAVGALSSDGCFYRALLKQKPNPSSYEVLFLDFGNEEVVTTVTPLPSNLGSFASPAIQLHSSQPHNIPLNSAMMLKIQSIDENQAVFVHVNEEGQNVGKFVGKSWYSGHVAPEKRPSSPVVLQPKISSPQPSKQVNQPEPKTRRRSASSPVCPAAKSPLPSILNTLHVQPEPVVVTVTWIIDPRNFCVSVRNSLEQNVSDVNFMLTASYDQDCVGFSAFSGQLVSAKSSDGTCYRAYVKNRPKGEPYRVLFLDFGNEEDVPSVAPLPPQALSFPSSALQMTASDPLEVSENQVLYLRISKVETSFVTFTLMDQNGHEICELVGKPWYSGHLVESDSGFRSVTPALKEKLTMFTSMPKRQYDNSFEANVVWANTPKDVYLQKTCDTSELTELMEKIAKVAAGGKQKVAPIIGQVVLALFTDGVWYRAEVVGVSAEVALVHFFDYGNQTQISLSGLQLCPTELSEKAPFAIHAMLDGVESFTSDEANELVLNVWKVQVTGKVQGSPSVQLLGPSGIFGQPIQAKASPKVPPTASTLPPVRDTPQASVPAEESPKPPSETEVFCTSRFSEHPYVDIPLGKMVNVVVSSVSSPQLVFVNYFPSPDSVEKWNTLNTEIQSYCEARQAPAQYAPEAARFCLGRFSEDNQWYRAVVLGKVGEAFKVLFVDYGNMETVSGCLLPIPARFMELPVQALQCKLHGIASEEQWSEEVCGTLQNMLMGKNFEAEITSKEEDTFEIDIPAIRNQLVEIGELKLDVKELEPEKGSTSVAFSTTEETNVESCSTLSNEQSTIPVSIPSKTKTEKNPETVPCEADTGRLDAESETADDEDKIKEQELLKQIEICQQMLLSLKSGKK